MKEFKRAACQRVRQLINMPGENKSQHGRFLDAYYKIVTNLSDEEACSCLEDDFIFKNSLKDWFKM